MAGIFFPFRFSFTDYTVTSKSSSNGVFSKIALGGSLIMFFLTLECMPSSIRVRLFVDLTDIELTNFLEEVLGPAFRSESKGKELSCSCLSLWIEGIWAGVGSRLSCWSWFDKTLYFLLVVDCICASKKTSSRSNYFPSATKSANFFLYSSHFELKNMLVCINWCLSLSSCFFLSSILFLISS